MFVTDNVRNPIHASLQIISILDYIKHEIDSNAH